MSDEKIHEKIRPRCGFVKQLLQGKDGGKFGTNSLYSWKYLANCSNASYSNETGTRRNQALGLSRLSIMSLRF